MDVAWYVYVKRLSPGFIWSCCTVDFFLAPGQRAKLRAADYMAGNCRRYSRARQSRRYWHGYHIAFKPGLPFTLIHYTGR